MARAFALGDALGDRDLPRLLRCLDEELWEVKLDPKRSEIGLLYGLISKVRAMLMLKEMLREGWIKPESDYNRFKAQLERVPADQLPADKRFNPLALNPYVLFKALPQARRYSEARADPRHGTAAALQPAPGVEQSGRIAGVTAGLGADCRNRSCERQWIIIRHKTANTAMNTGSAKNVGHGRASNSPASRSSGAPISPPALILGR